MTVKEAKEKLQNLVDSLNVYNDDADLDIHIYDNGKSDKVGIYTIGFDKWYLYNRTGKVVLTIE